MAKFQFKEFSVEQKQSPAKITTDATVFAASIQISPSVKKVLEIGTGTGVLSLMLAQRFDNIEIDALEIHPDAFKEAKKNFQNSPWRDRLNVVFEDFNQYHSKQSYDLIFSNPPFFHNNLQSKTNQGKNVAYHTDQLSFQALAKGIDLNLAPKGEAHIMLPPYEMSLFEKEINSFGFQRKRSVELKHQPESKVIRLFNVFDRREAPFNCSKHQLYVRDESNNFHPSYVNLMKDFLTIF